MKTILTTSFLTAGLAGGLYYLVAQQGSPENAHPETLTRDYLESSLNASRNACHVTGLQADANKLKCAVSAFETTTKFYVHWRNAMSQSLYNSVSGTIIGNSSIGFHAAELDMTCGDTKKVTGAEGLAAQLEAVSDYVDICTNAIETGMSRLNDENRVGIDHKIQPGDLNQITASVGNLTP